MGLRIGSSKVSAIVKSPLKERGRFLFRVVDYDGTILQEAYLNKGDKIKLVAAPSHDGLTFQEWATPVTITNNEVTMPNSDVAIGPVYTTTSGLSEFFVTVNAATGLSMTLNMDGTKNWGDGTTDTSTTHTYASAGDYKITCNGTTISTCTSSSNLFGVDKDYRVTKIHLVGITSIGDYVLYQCRSLRALSLPKGLTSLGNYGMYGAVMLPSLIFPAGVSTLGNYATAVSTALKTIVLAPGITSLGGNAVRYNYNLEVITLPEGLTTLGNDCFRDCIVLKGITVPSTVTALPSGCFRGAKALTDAIIKGNVSLGGNVFYSAQGLQTVEVEGSITAMSTGNDFYQCSHLRSIDLRGTMTAVGSRSFYYGCEVRSLKFPSTVGSVAAEAFSCCFRALEYDFSACTSVPTLANVNAFGEMSKLCVIKVPASLETSWKAATNWSTYASQIVGV